MKVAFICDTHFGVRNDSPIFLENAMKFFDEQFFPYLVENKIKTVIHLGDLFDRRKYINFNTLNTVRDKFFQRLHDEGIHLHITIGNHDTYYKNTNNLNSIKELLEDPKVSKYIEKQIVYNKLKTQSNKKKVSLDLIFKEYPCKTSSELIEKDGKLIKTIISNEHFTVQEAEKDAAKTALNWLSKTCDFTWKPK